MITFSNNPDATQTPDNIYGSVRLKNLIRDIVGDIPNSKKVSFTPDPAHAIVDITNYGGASKVTFSSGRYNVLTDGSGWIGLDAKLNTLISSDNKARYLRIKDFHCKVPTSGTTMWKVQVYFQFTKANYTDSTNKPVGFISVFIDENGNPVSPVESSGNDKNTRVVGNDILYYIEPNLDTYVTGKFLNKILLTTNQVTECSFSNIEILTGYDTGKPLSNLNVALFGDSITARIPNTKNWGYLFEKKTGAHIVHNYAIASAILPNKEDTVMDGNPPSTSSSQNTLPNQIQKFLNNTARCADVDLIIIAIGTNGGISASDADLQAAFTSAKPTIGLADLDLTKHPAAMAWCVEQLRLVYPNAKIVWSLPIFGASKYPQSVSTWANYARTICDWLGIDFIDTYKCGITYRREQAGHTDLDDGLHPSEAGAEKMAEYISNAILNMYHTQTI